MLRAIILALVMFVALGTIVPIATEYAEAGAQKQQVRKKKKKRIAGKYRRSKKSTVRRYRSSKSYKKSRRYRTRSNVKRASRNSSRYRKNSKLRVRVSKKYSKTRKKSTIRKYSSTWRRAYNAKKSRQQTIAKRKRNMRLKRIRLARKNSASNPSVRRSYQTRSNPTVVSQDMARNQMSQVQTVDGNGDVSLDVIGPAIGETSMQGRNKTVGGVSTTTLRRTVIDKMIQENGWVENDYQKDIGGKKVYVVVAKSADKNNQVQSRTFYFAESNGQIYRVSSRASKDSSEQVVKKSEKLIQTLQNPDQRVQQAQRNNTVKKD